MALLWVFSNLEWYLLRLELWRNVTQRNGEHRGLFITKLLLAQRHRWCVEEQRIFASFINALVYLIPKQWLARFLKTFITKAISNMYTTPLSLFVPSTPPWDCLLYLRVLHFCVWPFFKVLISIGITPNCWKPLFFYWIVSNCKIIKMVFAFWYILLTTCFIILRKTIFVCD